MSGLAVAVLPELLQAHKWAEAKLRHWLRKAQDSASRPRVDHKLLDQIVSNATIPSAMEQANHFIVWLGRHSAYPGQEIRVPLIRATAIMGAPTNEGYRYILNYLVEENLVEDRTPKVIGPPRDFTGTLSVPGWHRFQELERRVADSRIVFMAMRYGDPLLDRLFSGHFVPAIAQTGLQLRRLDDRPKAGLIDDRLRVEIRNCVLLLADLTYNNSGVYWEAGYAEGLGRPVLYSCHEDFFRKRGTFAETGGTHFDTNHCLTILWREDSIGPAAEQLKAAIRVTLPAITKPTDE